MNMINAQTRLHILGNAFGLLLICLALIFTFVDQLYEHDLPCPLCLLQRASFIAIGIGMCMNLRIGIRSLHYGLILISALCGLLVAVRQIALHLAPGDPGYGDVLFGLHFYVWAAIAFCSVIGSVGVALMLEAGIPARFDRVHRGLIGIMVFFILLIAANMFSTLFECGIGPCVANPEHYQF